MSMPVIQQPYSEDRLHFLYNYLSNYEENGDPLWYEIQLDFLKIVPKTNETERFWKFQDFLSGDAKTLTVLIYEGNSPKNQKHVFTFKEEKPQVQSLNGIENGLGELVQKQVNEFKREFEIEQLKKELKEANEYIAELETEREDRSEQLKPLAGLVGNAILNGVMSSPILSKLAPGLAGLPEAGKMEAHRGVDQETEISFKPKVESSAHTISETDRQHIAFSKSFAERFSHIEISKVMQILNELATDKELIDEVLEFISEEESPTKEN